MYQTTLITFNELTVSSLYQLLKLRTDIFVVEQDCPYPELDNRDQDALHGLAYEGEKLIGCLRILPRKSSGAVAIGRVAVQVDYRSHGIARRLLNEAIAYLQEQGEVLIDLQAQAHLKEFYGSFGFEEKSEIYLEDGIPHLDMQMQLSEVPKRLQE
ncbi:MULTISPECIES: GNAT family N-acetyltransferase [Exiguobacterium]|uniref:GNAT family N-acetyltransferase n=1 Tax=Exiguobacterium TaxID=33986 RepID=UPI0004789BE1|nr:MULTISPECIES: GNAT family N-acetyltransferase [Exiguobacterium]MCT4781275.1 GNAT family N-acetyltransferase [Exiguobacterium soli]